MNPREPPCEYNVWREAWRRVKALDDIFASGARPGNQMIEETARWIAKQGEIPRLAFLHTLLTPGISREALWSALVPVERHLAKLKITDVEILEGDGCAAGGGAEGGSLPLTVVLDSLRSAFNVGSIFRTAECFGVREIVLCGYTATPEHPAVGRSAMGTQHMVKWRHVADIGVAVRELRENNVRCVALETAKNARPIGEFEWEFPTAVILGNERFGVRGDIVKLCDAVVRIPLLGAKNSLNVAGAFAIAAFSAADALQKG